MTVAQVAIAADVGIAVQLQHRTSAVSGMAKWRFLKRVNVEKWSTVCSTCGTPSRFSNHHQIDGSITRRRVMRGHRNCPGVEELTRAQTEHPHTMSGRVGRRELGVKHLPGGTFSLSCTGKSREKERHLASRSSSNPSDECARTHEPVETCVKQRWPEHHRDCR